MERLNPKQLALYLGGPAEFTTIPQGRQKIGEILPCDLGGSEAYSIKPVLRPLSDMTEEEGATLSLIESSVESEGVKQLEVEASKIVYLLSCGFDLLGFIESGLAIDKTKQPVEPCK